MKFFDFCAGIGAGRLGLEQAGMECVGFSEINRSAINTYKILHNCEHEKNYGNIRKIKAEDLPDFDLMISGFPCQTFSVIGRQEGMKDPRGQLIFNLIEILKAKNVKYFIFENVKGLTTHDGGKTLDFMLKAMKKAGYHVGYKVLTSMEHGVPQMRQRVYFIGIRKDLAKRRKKFNWDNGRQPVRVEELLIDENNEISDIDYDYFMKYLNNTTNYGKTTIEKLLKQEYVIIDTRQSDLRLYYNRMPTLRSHRDGVYYVRNGKLRYLTGREALLFQGFPKEYADKVKGVVSNRDLLMQAGNAMTVGVVKSIGESLIDYVNDVKPKIKKNELLVGVVRTKEQREYCLAKNCYYTYCDKLTNAKDINFVAMYQPKNSFGDSEIGVKYYGRVVAYKQVLREDILFDISNTKGKKKCWLFEVDEWIELERNKILPNMNGAVLVMENCLE